MKWVLRTIIILLAAFIVTGATIAFSGSTASGNPAGRPQGEFAPPPNSNGPRRERGDRGGAAGLFNIGEVLGHFAVVAAIVAPFAAYSVVKNKRRLRQ